MFPPGQDTFQPDEQQDTFQADTFQADAPTAPAVVPFNPQSIKPLPSHAPPERPPIVQPSALNPRKIAPAIPPPQPTYPEIPRTIQEEYQGPWWNPIYTPKITEETLPRENRVDEMMWNLDLSPQSQRTIDRIMMNQTIPEWLKPSLARGMGWNLGTTEGIVNLMGDPTNLLGLLAVRGNIPRGTSLIPPTQKIKGTSKVPPSAGMRADYGVSGTGEPGRFPLPTGPSGYFPALSARVRPPEATTTGTGTPATLQAGTVPYTVEVPPTVETPPITGTGVPTELVPPGQFVPGGTGTGGWSSITAVVPPEPPPSITKVTPSDRLGILDRLNSDQLVREFRRISKIPDNELTPELAQQAVDIARKLGYHKEGNMLNYLYEKAVSNLKRFVKDESGELRLRFGGEEPGPETASDYRRTDKLLTDYEKYVRGLPEQVRKDMLMLGQKVPNFDKYRGVRSNRKIWVDNYAGGKGAYVSRADIIQMAENWNQGKAVTRPKPSVTEEPEITTADYGRLRDEQEFPFISDLSPEQRRAQLAEIREKIAVGRATTKEIEWHDRLQRYEDSYGEGGTAQKRAPQDTRIEPAATETPALEKRARERKTKEIPAEPADTGLRNDAIDFVKKLIPPAKDVPAGQAISRIREAIINHRWPEGGWLSILKDFDSIKGNPDIATTFVANWKKSLGTVPDLLKQLYKDDSGALNLGAFLKRGKKEERLPPGWSGSVTSKAPSAPRSSAKILESRIRQVPRKENFGSDVDLGGLDTRRPQGLLGKMWDLPRNLMGFDPAVTSAGIRQVFTEVGSLPWRRGLENSFKAWGDHETLAAITKQILQDPMAQPKRDSTGKIIAPSPLKQMGIRFSSVGSRSAMEEAIRGEWGAKIPLLNRSTRAFTAFSNTAKFELAKKGWDGIPGIQDDIPLQRLYGDFVNNVTGSGGLGRGEKIADELSTIFFAPRLVASRFHVMRQLVNPKLPWQIRKQYIKSAVRGAATLGGIALAAERFVPGVEVVKDPTNPDFMKVKYKGKVRIDLGAGYQQIFVLLNKLRRLQATSSTTGETHNLNAGNPYWTWQGEVGKFALNKLHPSARFTADLGMNMWNFLNSEAELGNKMHLPDRLLQMVTPLNLQALFEVADEDPSLLEGIGIGGLGLLGIPTQSYEKGDEFGAPVMWPPHGMEDYDIILGDEKGGRGPALRSLPPR